MKGDTKWLSSTAIETLKLVAPEVARQRLERG